MPKFLQNYFSKKKKMKNLIDTSLELFFFFNFKYFSKKPIYIALAFFWGLVFYVFLKISILSIQPNSSESYMFFGYNHQTINQSQI